MTRDITAADFLEILSTKPLDVWTIDSVVLMTDMLPSKEWALLPQDVQRQVLDYIIH